MKHIVEKLQLVLLAGCGVWLACKGAAYWQAQQQLPSSIVVLGGGIRREMQAAALARAYPDLPVLISSGSTLPCLYRVFVKEQEILWDRLTVDFRAVDTVTNFTALLPYLKSRGPQKVLVVVSKGQWQRASLLGWAVWGTNGIAMEPVRVEGDGHNESPFKTFRDGVRVLAWIVLGDVTVDHLYHSGSYLEHQKSLQRSRCELGQAELPASLLK